MHLPAPELPGWLEAELPFERYRVDVGGHAMHVMEQGRGPAVLLVHGNPTWGFLYRKVARALGNRPLRLIMPDLVGLGFSDKPAQLSAHTLENHIAWLTALVEALKLERVTLVVQDWGGPIGLGAFAAHPARLRSLVLCNTVIGPPRPGFRATSFHRFAQLPVLSDLAFRGLGFPPRGLRWAQGDRHSIAGDVARAYRYPLRRLADRAAPLAMARMVPDSQQHPSIEPLRRCQALVEHFRGPSAIVWGDRDPVLGRVRRHIQRVLPEAPVKITNAGHFLQEEVPELIAQAIVDVRDRGD